MKKRNLIIIGIIIFVIFLVFVFFLILSPKAPSKEDILKNPDKAMEFCAKSPSDKQLNCYLQIADVLKTENSDVALQACMSIKIEGDKKQCVEDLAFAQPEQTKAVEICNSMKDDTKFREHCFGGVMANFPNVNTNTQLIMCDSKTGTDKDNCYRRLAEDFIPKDPSKSVEICNKITDSSIRDGCLNNILSNPEIIKSDVNRAIGICDSMTLKDRCYMYVASTTSAIDPKKAAQICQRLSDDVQVLSCYNNVWFSSSSLVVANYDFTVNLCDALTLKKDECLNMVMPFFIDLNRTKAAEICKLMSSSASSQCLQSVNR